MINHIYIKNFKLLADVSLPLSPLNVITGANGMGKSSLIQVLLLLRQSYLRNNFQEGVLLQGDLTDNLGEFDDVCYRGAAIDDEILFEIKEDEKDYAWKLRRNNLMLDTLQGVIPNISATQMALFSKNHFQYIGAGRVAPNTQFGKSGSALAYKQFGKNGEYAIQYLYEKGASVSALFSDYLSSDTQKPLPLINQVNYWLSHITTNVTLDIRVKSNTEYELRYRFLTNQLGVPESYSATNSAFGLTFALPIITAILAAEKGDLLILENPESDLHPQAQSLIGQLMARAAAAGVQIIVETHSDHILNGICVAIHKGLLNNELAKVYYFHKQANEQHTTAYEVPIKENGRIDDKPLRIAGIPGFFDQLDKDLETILFSPINV